MGGEEEEERKVGEGEGEGDRDRDGDSPNGCEEFITTFWLVLRLKRAKTYDRC